MRLQTSCENCVFRKGVDCGLNLIESYEQQKALLPLGDRDFQMVDRVCLSRRETGWDGDNIDLYKEQTIHINYIILFDGDLDGLKKTLNSIHEQTLQPNNPARIILSFKAGKANIKECVKFLEENLDHTNFFISQLLKDPKDEHQNVDDVFNRCKNGYYYVVESGTAIPSNMYFCLWYMVFRQGLQCMALMPAEGIVGACVSVVMHKFVKGSSLLDLRSKLVVLAEEQKVEHMIHSWEKAYENFGG